MIGSAANQCVPSARHVVLLQAFTTDPALEWKAWWHTQIASHHPQITHQLAPLHGQIQPTWMGEDFTPIIPAVETKCNVTHSPYVTTYLSSLYSVLCGIGGCSVYVHVHVLVSTVPLCACIVCVWVCVCVDVWVWVWACLCGYECGCSVCVYACACVHCASECKWSVKLWN